MVTLVRGSGAFCEAEICQDDRAGDSCESFEDGEAGRGGGPVILRRTSIVVDVVSTLLTSLRIQERGTVDHSGAKVIYVGPENNRHAIRFDNLYLMQVDHVTTGSLQPQLAYLFYPPTVPQTYHPPQPAYHQYGNPGSSGMYTQQ